MAGLQIFEKLLQFPLFQGMCRDDLELVAGHTRFGFTKYAQGKIVATEGDACTQLFFLINGTIRIETAADDNGYWVAEQMEAPYILQPEAIFGYHQRYTHTFIAQTDVNFITIDKEEILCLTEDFLVFRLNLMNLLATQTQKRSRQPWRPCTMTLNGRLIRFFATHCVYPAGHKMFYVLMNRLAAELNDSRLNVSRALNQLQKDGMVILHRGRIEIPLMERLLM